MNFIQVTDEMKNNAIQTPKWCSAYFAFSDLSFYINVCLDGCGEEAELFGGVKATNKSWAGASPGQRAWLIGRLLTIPRKRSGLSQQDQGRIFAAQRTAKINYWKELIANSSAEVRKEIEPILKHLSNIGFKAVFGKISTTTFEHVWNMCTDVGGEHLLIREIAEEIQDFLGDSIQDAPSKGAPMADGKVVVSVLRKAMKNVGLRPDATSLWPVPAPVGLE